ncbi:hypothetical protein [Brassicibacter mesophilus]|uniref:hypothetical protein n=1 Tax=Brassicibacter mesophilus TaxID=745119 RepID=UPI003D2515E7
MVNTNSLKFKRATKEYREYCRDKNAFQSNNFYIAVDNEDNVLATGELFINSLESADLYTYMNKEYMHEDETIIAFVDEILYWNPFLKTISCTYGEIYNDNPVKVKKISIESIRPSQLSISEEKLSNVSSWLKSEDQVVIPVINSNDKYVATDGHTRLVQAVINGYKEVYIYMDNDANPDTYNSFINWCEAENIMKVSDLTSRILSDEEHKVKWVGRCEDYFRSLR